LFDIFRFVRDGAGYATRWPIEPEMIAEKLSSDITILIKTVLPALLLLGMVGGPIWEVVTNGLAWELYIVVPAWLVFGPMCFYFVRLKTVTASDEGLLVGNFVTNTCIPYCDIVAARQYHANNCTFVTLVLRNRTRFGEFVRYVAHSHFVGVRRESHPDLAVLRVKAPTMVEENFPLWPHVAVRCLLDFYIPKRA